MQKVFLTILVVFTIFTGCKNDEITQTPVTPTGTLIFEKDSLNLEVADTSGNYSQRLYILDSLVYNSIRVEFDGETNMLVDSSYMFRMLRIYCNTFGNISFGQHEYPTSAAINRNQVANINNGYGYPFDLVFFLQFPPITFPDVGPKYLRFKNIKIYDTSGS